MHHACTDWQPQGLRSSVGCQNMARSVPPRLKISLRTLSVASGVFLLHCFAGNPLPLSVRASARKAACCRFGCVSSSDMPRLKTGRLHTRVPQVLVLITVSSAPDEIKCGHRGVRDHLVPLRLLLRMKSPTSEYCT